MDRHLVVAKCWGNARSAPRAAKSVRFPMAFALLLVAGRPAEAGSCTHYASPRGGGNGLSPSSPFTIGDFWGVAQPGQTLCLLDGTYTFSAGRSMIQPPATVQGAPGQYITIRAFNEGKALLDGEFQVAPVELGEHNDYLIIEGLNAHNGRYYVYRVGADEVIIRRCIGWDTWIGNGQDGGVAIFSVAAPYTGGANNVLVEESAGWGVTRKIFVAPQNNVRGADGRNITFRRNWGSFTRWPPQTSQPAHAFELGYNSRFNRYENNIMAWDMDPGGNSPQTAVFAMFHDDNGSSDTMDLNSEALGTIVYVQKTYPYTSASLVEASNANYARIKDMVAIAEPGGTWSVTPRPVTTRLKLNPQNPDSVFQGMTAHDVFVDNVIGIGGVPNLIDWPTVPGGKPPRWGATVPQALGSSASIFTEVPGICFRYVDGQLTTQPLWPWAMNDRIKAAMALSGRPSVDVTATIERLLGPIPAACKTTLSVVVGDLDQDGRRTLADVRLLIYMLLGQVSQDLTRADMNRDGRLSLADVQALIRLIIAG